MSDTARAYLEGLNRKIEIEKERILHSAIVTQMRHEMALRDIRLREEIRKFTELLSV